MDIGDLDYVAHLVSDISMIPVRAYTGHEKILMSSPSPLPQDPADALLSRMDEEASDAFCLETDDFALYGYIRKEQILFVVGPFYDRRPDELSIERLGISLGVLPDEMDAWKHAMDALGIMPHETALLVICSLGFALTGRHLTVEDLAISQPAQETLSRELAQEEFGRNTFRPDVRTHSSREVEQKISSFISQGRPQELRSYLASIPTFRAGTLTKSYLRHTKDLLIVEATLASRSAIDGGLAEDEALGLSDAYIGRCESMQSTSDIAELGWHMLLDYAERVERLKIGADPSPLARGVADYVHAHIFEPIKTQDVADALSVSRGFLSTQFKRECGISLSDYIQHEKIEEAKRLLENTDQPLLAISTYLGFCSQSHFSTVFKKACGMTPNEWRKRFA
ncbi:MAG: helix-turn-helix domain-containing protein [Atopobiaceae bacterium]